MAVRRDPKTGTWTAEYYDSNRKQHRLKGFKTKRSALTRLEDIGVEIRKGVHVPDATSCKVEEACRVWLQRGRDEKLESATLRQYENHVNLHLLPLTDSGERPAWDGKFGDLKLSKLNTPVAEAVRRELSRRLSLAMARKVLASLKAILDEAQRHMLVAYNAARPVKMRVRDRGENKVHAGVDFPTKEELASVIAVIEGRWRVLIVTDAFTGLRSSELRGLEWPDVLDLKTEFPQIRVRQRADETGTIGNTKSDRLTARSR